MNKYLKNFNLVNFINSRKISKKHVKEITKFYNFYHGLFSTNTMISYLTALMQLLQNKINLSSKAKQTYYKIVKKKAKKINIKIDVYIPDWKKRGDTIKSEIEDKYVNKEGLKEILKACPNSKKGLELRKAIELSYYSGMRLNEVLDLNNRNIDFVGKHIKMIISGKGCKTRKLWLKLNATHLIENFKPFSIDDNYVKVTCYRISKQRLEKPFNFHSLRHSFAINFIKSGGNLVLLQKQLGHSNLATTSRYLMYYDDLEALSKLGF